MQKYNGKVIHNSCVEVDYDKKTVKFKPVKIRHIFWHYLDFTLEIWLILVIINLYSLYGAHYIRQYLLNQGGITINTSLLLIYPGVIALALSLPFLNRNFRDQTYPKAMRWMSVLTRLLLFRKGEKKLVINKNMMTEDNRIILPDYHNIFMEYETTGDFAKQLKRIRIDNIFKKVDSKWLCIFEFSKKPITGNLTVKYI